MIMLIKKLFTIVVPYPKNGRQHSKINRFNYIHEMFKN